MCFSVAFGMYYSGMFFPIFCGFVKLSIEDGVGRRYVSVAGVSDDEPDGDFFGVDAGVFDGRVFDSAAVYVIFCSEVYKSGIAHAGA